MNSLRGYVLIASPALFDPNFRRTVVLVGEHGEEGALGVVLNRPSAVTVADAVPPLAALVDEGDRVWFGGPVQPEAIVVLGEFGDPEQAAAVIVGSVGFLPAEVDPDELGALARVRVFAGYAGWGPGQLEGELAEDSWIVEEAVPDDVFWADPDSLWPAVLRRKGGPDSVLALMPPDPSVN
jgi:putative transcriptional regulator